MHNLKSLNTAFALTLIGILALSACDFFEQPDRTYTDDPKLEFKPLTQTADEGAGTVTTEAQLIGPQRDSDLPVNFVVDDSSSADAGEQYTLGSTSATIPAGESDADVTIDVLDNDIDDGDTNYILYLTLQASEGVEPAVNLKTYTLTIRGTDEEDDGGSGGS
jgi:hypothetical protein